MLKERKYHLSALSKKSFVKPRSIFKSCLGFRRFLLLSSFLALSACLNLEKEIVTSENRQALPFTDQGLIQLVSGNPKAVQHDWSGDEPIEYYVGADGLLRIALGNPEDLNLGQDDPTLEGVFLKGNFWFVEGTKSGKNNTYFGYVVHIDGNQIRILDIAFSLFQLETLGVNIDEFLNDLNSKDQEPDPIGMGMLASAQLKGQDVSYTPENFLHLVSQFISWYDEERQVKFGEYETVVELEQQNSISRKPVDTANLEDASRKGDLIAIRTLLDIAARNSNGVTPIELLMRAANQGDADAMFTLASAYLKGDGVDFDVSKAMDFFSQAMALGHAEAFFEAGKLFDAGVFIHQDKQRAMQLWYEGALKGSSNAKQAFYKNNPRNFNADSCIRKQPGSLSTIIEFRNGFDQTLDVTVCTKSLGDAAIDRMNGHDPYEVSSGGSWGLGPKPFDCRTYRTRPGGLATSVTTLFIHKVSARVRNPNFVEIPAIEQAD